MRFLRSVVRNLLHRGRAERELDEELQGYEALLADEKRQTGLDDAAARLQARLEVGASMGQLKEEVREAHMSFILESIWRDVRVSARSLLKRPGFALTVVAVLALGIGGATAIFSIFNSLQLRPLPYPDSERLVNLDEKAPDWKLERTGVAYPDFAAWREHNRSFDGIAVVAGGGATLTGSDSGAEQVPSARATHDLLHVLRVQPAIGRWFAPDEDKPNGPKLVVLSDRLWQRRFGGPPAINGQTLRINAESFAVIGVMPPEFDFPGRAEVWTALGMSVTDRSGWFLSGVARLKTGVTMEAAVEDLTRIHRGMIQQRKENAITSPTIYPLRDWYVGRYLSPTRVLLGAVALLLVIACANVAGVVLARGSARTREVSLLTALGAPRARIVRQLLTESLLLAIVGGGLGVLLGSGGLRLLLSLLPAEQLPTWVRFDWDWRFLCFTMALSMGSAVVFGLWPAWSASRADLRSALQGGARGSDTFARKRGLQILITAEVALALILLAGAALLTQAFRQVERTSPGFRAGQVLTYSVNLPNQRYAKPEKQVEFFQELVRESRMLPGVEAAAVTSGTPLGGHWGDFFETEGAPARRPGDPNPVVLVRVVSAGYLETMGMTVLAGRAFEETDGRSEGAYAVVVNESFARLAWPGQDPIGKRIRGGRVRRWSPIVGMIADVKDYGLDEPSRPSVYFPMLMGPGPNMSVTIRTVNADPSMLTSAAREVLRRLDPEVAMVRPTTMEARLNESMWIRRMYSFLVVAFAVLALILVGTGLFGVISDTVGRRNREIAIRMALGAKQSEILRGVLREALAIAVIGAALGVGGGLALLRVAQSFKFESLLAGIDPRDPLTYTACAAILALVALAASLLPASRAARVAPSSALRMD